MGIDVSTCYLQLLIHNYNICNKFTIINENDKIRLMVNFECPFIVDVRF
jgi:hypothetical protein